MQKRFKTKYPGVIYRHEYSKGLSEPEKVYYIRYRLGGRGAREIEEPVYPAKGQTMSARMASEIRADRMRGREPSNAEKRAALMDAALQVKDGRLSIGWLWQQYKQQRPDLKGLTTDDNRFKNHLAIFASMLPEEIQTTDIDNLRLRLTKAGKSPQTIKNVLELLRRIINFGVRKGWCAIPDPARLAIAMPRVNNQRTEDLTPEQLDSLIKAMDEDPNQKAANLMRLALFTGMRRGELFRLKWDDVDWHRGFIRIAGETVNGYDIGPKGGISKKIPLNSSAEKLLRQLKDAPDSDASPYVFPGKDGKGQLSDIRRQVKRIKEKAGLSADFRALHGLRHTFASMLASSGKVDMYTLQKLLTHQSAKMTERYAHLRDDALQKASNVLDEFFKDVNS